MPAAQQWIKLATGKRPPLHKGVLIRTIAAGPTYDVACYIGRDTSGNDRWICADATLDTRNISHYAIINDAEDEQ